MYVQSKFCFCLYAALLIKTFVLVSCTQLQSEIQAIIKDACLGIAKRQHGQGNAAPIEISDTPLSVSVQNMYSSEKNFNSLIPTIVLFIEQDPFYNAPMNLDVNF